METSQEQNLFNPTTNLASKPEAEEDQTLRLSSSSSSCSSTEAEPRPDNNNVDQSPPRQIMERSTNNTTPTTPPYRIPPHVFDRTPSTAPAEWSSLSNESLFSIHMGNNSFSGGDYFKSDDLTFPQPPSPRTPTLPSPLPPPPQNNNQGGSRVVEEAKTQSKKAADTEKAYRTSKEEEQKAAASIRAVIMANEDNNNKTNKLDRSVSHRSEDFSVKSFAFPVFKNADKGGLQGPTPQKKLKISSQAERDEELKKEEATKPGTPKAEADRGCNRYPGWLSCFPCCTS